MSLSRASRVPAPRLPLPSRPRFSEDLWTPFMIAGSPGFALLIATGRFGDVC